MIINKITLRNFGAYEGINNFITTPKNKKNIILVGGKNGAGKTTLFVAMRVCLYGFRCFGYKNINASSIAAITKLINKNTLQQKPAQAAVTMDVSLSNGQTLDSFVLSREWTISDNFSEQFRVSKNGVELNEEETADFEKYILSLLPPELFNLYFFDGETIADFFMDEGANLRIKDAFLTICGYDTFDIMNSNFKRIGTNIGRTSSTLKEYTDAKDRLSKAIFQEQAYKNKIVAYNKKIEEYISEIDLLSDTYKKTGGLSQEAWNNKIVALKQEELRRETLNATLKKLINDVIPFLMIKDQLVGLGKQIKNEAHCEIYNHFCEVFLSDDVKNLLARYKKLRDEIKFTVAKKYCNDVDPILKLSAEDGALLGLQIQEILSHSVSEVSELKKEIKFSIDTSARIRKFLDKKHVSSVKEYTSSLEKLSKGKESVVKELTIAEQNLVKYTENVHIYETELSKLQAKLESEIKQTSIHDISGRAVLMLDALESFLYNKQLRKMEEYFREEVKALARKANFIDDIVIDNDFNIHIYRDKLITFKQLHAIASSNTKEQVIKLFGGKAISMLNEYLGEDFSEEDFAKYCEKKMSKSIKLPIEIDKTTLSNGEKQIFIMALYHSLVKLSKSKLPFVIDTPFARIDTEHRRNISKNFFCRLPGQVFILSTNEEIGFSDIEILKGKICATYMLVNDDNSRTSIVKDQYFEAY